jgi:nitrogen-specific signal transduction histidine kinase
MLRTRVPRKADEPLDDVSADKNQFEQVLVNVVRNAVQAIGEEGRILPASGRDNVRRWLAARDSGQVNRAPEPVRSIRGWYPGRDRR